MRKSPNDYLSMAQSCLGFTDLKSNNSLVMQDKLIEKKYVAQDLIQRGMKDTEYKWSWFSKPLKNN